MKEQSIDNVLNGLELLAEKPAVKYVFYGVVAVIGLYLMGTIVLPVITTLIVSMKGLRTAIHQPA